ncbi:hypothetical protein Sta7437_3453 [Stanieria cyanosphaera PCC 7437]|uniref:Glycosyltransferase RgtA/B/C/D-like domain-containing protein n=1 Tax=Stanieria cyanosphaera (strain ATCC 29371 / PCC 7437) TaxID=111780 RepID=K9XY20_STAC7|nr:hypothetical protein [Stanieria cyanosphaera]AFZ36954.1 hypothetical protein Sta7437_3453 [Stanieria cyanosphaera PCC 7437]
MLAKKVRQKTIGVQIGLLGLSMLVGFALRFTNLDAKPPWADEWATLVFSLGNSFRTIPLDRLIDLNTLLLPLQQHETIQPQAVINHLMEESTHPPVYFVLTNLWLGLFSDQTGLVSLWWARALSALLGVAAIPAMFGLGWLLSRSLLVAQLAAALMAVSPYGIYLAQEARHYTLVILLIIASLACLIVAVRNIEQKKSLNIATVLTWIVINSLGVATHYFFGLALVSEIVVLFTLWIQEVKLHWRKRLNSNTTTNLSPPLPLSPSLLPHWWHRIIIAIAGTIVGCSGWLFTWRDIPDHELTAWIEHGNIWGGEFFEPIGRLFGWLITMLYLLPIENTPLVVTIISIVIVLGVILWLIGQIIQYLQSRQQLKLKIFVAQTVGNFWLTSIILVLIFAYFWGKDLTLAARFQFFYFPATILLVAIIFTLSWSQILSKKLNILSGRNLAITTIIIGFLGGITVINNYGYQKPDRPDLIPPVMLEAQQIAYPNVPVLVATVHKTHEQTGEMMGIAWEWHKLTKNKSIKSPQFLLLHKDQDANLVTQKLHQIVNQFSRPLNIWIVNFSASAGLESQGCYIDEKFKHKPPGYSYRLYHCLPKQDS